MFQDTPTICVPITNNPNFHSSNTEIIALYLYFQSGDMQLINFSHPDSIPSGLELKDIKLHPNSLVLNKKSVIRGGLNCGIDLNSYLQYYVDDIINPSEFYGKAIEKMQSQWYNNKNLGKIIPISKWIEFAEGIVLYALPYYKPDKISENCIAFCDDFMSVFHLIEMNDVPFDNEMRKQNYMWYTATSRPSNAWNNFNFSALNKNDGTREKIHSRFDGGKLVQFDYDAFHIKLLGKILDYKFTKHPYEQIKEELNLHISYDEVKSKVFQNIYGTITSQFIEHPFFQRVQAMIDELYSEYQTVGYIESYFYRKRFREIGEPSPNKIFNYFLQSLETEYNVRKIKTILPLLKDTGAVFCMYLYDAFIFDIPFKSNDLILTIGKALETDGMSTKCSIGDNFGNMEPYL